MLTTVLAFIVVIGVLIFVHELGHFVTAKLVDIEVPRFSIGLGPKLWGFRRGETEYVISWLPLGGYVKMAGMEEMEAIEGGPARREAETGVAGATDMGLVTETGREGRPRPRDFESKSLPARTLVISAGVIMNIIFALVVFASIALVWGIERDPEARLPVVDASELPAGTETLAAVPAGETIVQVGDVRVEDFGDVRRAILTAGPGPLTLRFAGSPAVTIDVPANDTMRVELIAMLSPDSPPLLGAVEEGAPADRAGFRTGDRVAEIDGQPVRTWRDLVESIRARPNQAVPVTVERDGRRIALSVVPEEQSIEQPDGTTQVVGRIGVGQVIERDHPGVIGALGYGVGQTWEVTVIIVDFLVDLFTGDASPRSLGGPIMIGQLSGEVARLGVQAFLNFMALFSVNLAILNLLPIPVLDGGHLMFLAIEAVRGRALSLEQRMRFTQVGFFIVLAIMVWAIANDVLRLFGL